MNVFTVVRRGFLATDICEIVGGYIARTPLYDPGVQRTVTRLQNVVGVAGRAAVRVACRVLLHEGSNLDPGVFSEEWTRGLLGELAELLNGNNYCVEWIETDGGPALIVSKP
jgi:hypothetical protein